MTAGHNPGPGGWPLWHMARRRLLLVPALAGVLTACLMGPVPVARADDARSQQWYLDAMQAEKMWKVSTGKGIKVAVVDTGVDSTTDSLRGQVLPGIDATGLPGEATDDYAGHGTTIAEYIVGTGRNGGLQGLAPGAKVIPVRAVLDGFKEWEKTTKRSSDAIRAAADTDAQILNLSFAGMPFADTAEAVEYALSKGKLVFAGVGNDRKGDNLPSYPAGYPGVVGVAASDKEGEVGEFSQSGDYVDLSAPGVDIPVWCDEKLQSYCTDSGGTSMATAIASASAALIWSKHPDWTANQVLRVLVDTAGRKDGKKDVASRYIGYGAVRPRIHLLEGEGDPGDPDKNPIEAVELDASPPASPSPEGNDAKSGDKAGNDRVEKASSEAAAEESDNDLWIYLGAGAAAAVVAVGAFVLVRRTRRT
ncbi:S8 family serine peptidase [Streptomyces sp. TRM 70361]|uniref:S8 family serine peptidase n=1 Tax=Streptomyces sp. TRM 70361 TaxID=3116553 RepID=UPI002E7AB5E2|nr:S8 family serine peptidase [Streptomyces sp. TRM 70361]MEE1941776.1 S8 family serine peptidase [Streptomyces sp. TRM 70361]